MSEVEEMCPICRSSTYLNPQMKFLLNSECYHKICESCVDRIFGKGPAPCPYRNCGKKLRRQKFKTQMFEDLAVEKEVDVRQRITKIFNRPEESFESPRKYDDYLEKIETLIFSLAGEDGPEKEEAQREVKEYEAANRQEILDNAIKQRQQKLIEEEVAKQLQERDRRLRILALELESQEKEYRLIMQHETVDALAAGKNAKESATEAADRAKQRISLLRNQYEMELARSKLASQQMTKSAMLSSEHDQPATPFTPFNGDHDAYTFHLQPQYFDPLLSKLEDDPSLRAGGFNAKFAEYGALACAFMGIEVDIQQEKAASLVKLENGATGVEV